METRNHIWQQMIADWLELKRARSASAHTRRAYASAMGRWMEFLGDLSPAVALWEVDAGHVRQWQQALRAHGLAESSVNQHLSCVSSFYTFVRDERRFVQGMEGCPFADRTGNVRRNPFLADNVQRGRAHSYDRARVLSRVDVAQLLAWLDANAESVAGARNRALLLTFLYTGWQSAELLRMRWGDLRPSQLKPGTMIYAWRGKGNRRADDVLPAACYQAICAYLRLAGRLGDGRKPSPHEAIWLPVTLPRTEHLRNAPRLDASRPITEQNALRILRSALRGAGIRQWAEYRIPDLRHTHARVLMENGQSLEVVQKCLHHTSAATTRIYVNAVHAREPDDVASDAFAQLLAVR